jgi:ornithine carbamoyltransferase
MATTEVQESSREARIAAAQNLVAARRGQRRGKPERSFLTIADLSPSEVAELLAGGIRIKKDPGAFRHHLQDRAVALLFQKTSTRTRVSFEIGTGEMGGQPIYLDWRSSNFTLADLQDESKVLSRYVDLIMARVNDHADLETMRSHSEVPVINGLSNLYHPCQGLTDYMTILEYFGELRGLRLAYIGDGNNVCHSLINAGLKTGVHVAVAHPPGYGPSPEVVAPAQAAGLLTLTHDPAEAVRDADVLYTDTWISMGDEAQRDIRLQAFASFKIDEALLAKAPSHALVMHCLPAHRGYEISSGALDSRNSVVFDQAENRKHLQKYLMAWMLETTS